MPLLLKRFNKREESIFKSEIRQIPLNPPYVIQLEEAPDFEREIIIPGFTRELERFPGPNKFYADEIGFLYFNSADAGKVITINYFGRGSIVIDADVNNLQDYVKQIEIRKIDKIGNPVENRIILCSNDGGIKISDKRFNDLGSTANDIWSAEKIISYLSGFVFSRRSYNNVYIGNGVQKIFSLSPTYIENTERVYVNGIRQTRGIAYTVSGNAVIFEEPIPVGYEVVIDFDYY